jgi:succinoglycan biosynthesis transport protein ExoP
MDLRRQLAVLRHWAWLIIASVLLAGGVSYLVSSSLPKVYEGKATLIVGQSLTAIDPDYNQLLASQRLSQTYATVATTRPILDRVLTGLDLGLPIEDLEERVAAGAPRDSTLITITAQWGDPDTAAAIANAIAEELIAASPTIQGQQVDVQRFVDDELAATQGQIEATQADVERLLALPSRTAAQEQELQTLQSRLVAVRQTYAQLLQFSSNSAANLLSVVEPAVPITDPASPRVLLNTVLAMALGLLVAVGLAFLFEYLDDTVKSPDDVREIAGAPTLGVIARMKADRKLGVKQHLVTLVAPRSSVAEAFRTLRTNLEFASVDKALGSLLFTSAIPAEGKTTIASNTAVAFAQAGKRVILLDADMRRPGVHRMFELPNSYGLTNLLRTDELPISSLVHATDEPNLRVMTTGALPPNPAELLGSQRMKEILRRLESETDLLILDSPPLQAVTDAAILAREVTGSVLVIDAGRTRKGAVRQAREALERVGAGVLGVSINRISERSSAAYYYQYYGDYYGHAGEVIDESRKATPRTIGQAGPSSE